MEWINYEHIIIKIVLLVSVKQFLLDMTLLILLYFNKHMDYSFKKSYGLPALSGSKVGPEESMPPHKEPKQLLTY